MSPPNRPLIVVDAKGTSSITFLAHDATDSRFFIRGRIDPRSDYMTYHIVTRILSTGEKSAINPEQLFDAMMTHFAGQVGGLPDAIHAIWEDNNPMFITNLVRFNAALATGDSDITAARKTFTGRMATKYGYTTITFGYMNPLTGLGPFKTANVYFKR